MVVTEVDGVVLRRQGGGVMEARVGVACTGTRHRRVYCTPKAVIAGGFDEAFGVAIQAANGRIVAAGGASVPGTTDFAMARYKTDGSLDTTFSADGKVTTDFAGDFDIAIEVAIQANGRIVAAGLAFVSGNGDFALSRYTCFRRSSRPIFNPLCS